jgi:hypothetical protein
MRDIGGVADWGDISGLGDGHGGWGDTNTEQQAPSSPPPDNKKGKGKRKRGVSPPPAPPPMRAKDALEVSPLLQASPSIPPHSKFQ